MPGVGADPAQTRRQCPAAAQALDPLIADEYVGALPQGWQ